MDPRLADMLRDFIDRQEAATTSKYWSVLCRKNVAQLLETGYENFKQTVALNYFTWIVGKDDPQFLFLKSHLPQDAVTEAEKRAAASRQHAFMTKEQSEFYNLMTYLLWEYAAGEVGANLLNRLEEPVEGNPPSVMLDGRNISQDLANSVLEYDSVIRGLSDVKQVRSIIELGGGYGRTAYAFLSLLPSVRYFMVDIPPALYIAERYLTRQFPDRKIFPYRSFKDFRDVDAEFREAQIAFLMPEQLDLLPDRSVDLFLAVDCLHEMRPEQIMRYYRTIDRIADCLYQKCWKKTKIPYDDIALTEEDYPFFPNWRNLFFRDCRVQSTYFEALFRIDHP
ncbi:MAG TPA: putative sugar O-methyltransferase [Syntrophales bacterium]|nr:putative sugar O-methyltransferase [Syntrophales bacterium]